ncbi:hypothetical protein Syun_025290 [Stephania yunnanensis]|uniref:Uncharacterized protein n=1 Tax=Stephania yunnanensis TaxID=152371 RepID=A0AAP0ERD9_9MAGN
MSFLALLQNQIRIQEISKPRNRFAIIRRCRPVGIRITVRNNLELGQNQIP